MADCEIKISDNGPLIVRGEFDLKDPNGESFGLGGRQQVALCRCGESKDKPFCDGAHRAAGFQSTIVCRNLDANK